MNKDCTSPYFHPHVKVPNQNYCSSIDCQRERRRIWQKSKRSNDDDYKKDQIDAQNVWLRRNPGYWKEYRKNNPGYTERNRRLQKIRNLRAKHRLKVRNSKIEKIAKMDEYEQKKAMLSGYYTLYPINVDKIAKMDAILVKIDVITMD
jgi:hypothetical protein